MASQIEYTVRVTDIYVGTKGYPVEECVTVNALEANTWLKQWKTEYPRDEGFRIKMSSKMVTY